MDRDPLDELKNLPPEVLAGIKARRAVRQAEFDEQMKALREKEAGYKLQETCVVVNRNAAGQIDINPENTRVLRQWTDAAGHTIFTYTKPSASVPDISRLSNLGEVIRFQQSQFSSLPQDEQTKIRDESRNQPLNPSGTYGAYLTNEALSAQFQQLRRFR